MELDKKFHNTLSDISKNYLIESLFSTISNLFEKFIEDAIYKIILFDSEQANKSLLIQHKKICESIIKKNQDMAVEAMREHMEYIMENAVK